ncbi:MAG: hypothetical protein LBS85_04500 [Clostridiales Family XIII bacterium]|nr:hypothetical protein [Clostridiales Family XIII bacterium]
MGMKKETTIVTGTRGAPEVAAALRRVLKALGRGDTAEAAPAADSPALPAGAGGGYDVGVHTIIDADAEIAYGTVEDCKKAILSLFESVKRSVVNADDPFSAELLRARPDGDVVRYGIFDVDACDLYADKLLYDNDGVRYDIVYRLRKEDEALYMSEQGHQPFTSRIPVFLSRSGQTAVYTTLAAAGACIQLGVDLNRLEPILGDDIFDVTIQT